jgi:anti-anti-sigma factor
LLALELGDTCVELLDDGDLVEPEALQDGLERAVADEHHRRVVLDLSRLREITSAVIAVLVGAEASGATCGTPVALACARRRVRRAFAGLRDLLAIHDSVGPALEAIDERATVGRGRGRPEEKRRRKEAAMEGEHAEDGAGQEDASPERAEAVAGEGFRMPPSRPETGQEEEKEVKTEPEAAAPPHEVPESVMQHLRERAPDLAEALPREAEPTGPGSPAGPAEPEAAAPVETDAAPEVTPTEVPAEQPAPPEPVAVEKKPRKKTARKRKSAGKKSRAKRKRKSAKKSPKGKKKKARG